MVRGVAEHLVAGALRYQNGEAFDGIAVVLIKAPLPSET